MLRTLALLLVALLLMAPAAIAQGNSSGDAPEGSPEDQDPADPTKDALGGVLGEDQEVDTATTTEELGETGAEVLADAPAGHVPLLERILVGAGDLVSDVGGAIADGVSAVFSAIGNAILFIVTGIGNAIVATGTFVGRTLVWTITGVAGIMGGILTFGASTIIATIAGLGDLVHATLAAYATARPAAVHPTAWAGGAAATTAVAAGGAQAGLYTWLKRLGWFAPGAGVPLFSRIDKDDVLNHPLRSTIFETIRANPGIHVSALSRAVDAGWGTTVHHLRKLQENELVAVRTVNNQKCFFENGGQLGRSQWAQVSELKSPTAERIARFILDHPLQPLTAVSEALRISPSLVSHHVSKLVRAEVVQKVRDGRFVKLTITEEARARLFSDPRMLDAPAAPVLPTATRPSAA